jgi:hypothetical protein
MEVPIGASDIHSGSNAGNETEKTRVSSSDRASIEGTEKALIAPCPLINTFMRIIKSRLFFIRSPMNFKSIM